MTRQLHYLVRFTLILTLAVVILGAYTRLTDAGLGCPDWPGCYGSLLVPEGEAVIQAELAFPERKVEPDKAWNEMIHRYLASSLGLVIVIIAGLIFWHKQKKLYLHAVLLVLLVCFQGALGMWTVTLNLLPVIVMGHLLGGFSVFCLLCLLAFRMSEFSINLKANRYLPQLGVGAGVILMLQIALGGWTSANYAALVCTELPICQGEWQHDYPSQDAFHLLSPEADNYEFGVLAYPARVTIHVTHRLGAVVTTAILLSFIICLFKAANCHLSRRVALLMVALLITQVLLGVSNIVFMLPIGVAVAHNFVALLLLASLCFAIYSVIYRQKEAASG